MYAQQVLAVFFFGVKHYTSTWNEEITLFVYVLEFKSQVEAAVNTRRRRLVVSVDVFWHKNRTTGLKSMFFFHLIKVLILIKRRPGERNWMNENWVELPMNVQTVRYGKNDALRYKRYVNLYSWATLIELWNFQFRFSLIMFFACKRFGVWNCLFFLSGYMFVSAHSHC